jgi:hypothetical protein
MASATRLRIPKEAHEGFARLLALGDDAYRSLERALQDAAPKLKPGNLASFVAERVGDAQENIQDIVTFLLSLYQVRTNMGLGISQFVEKVCQALDTENDSALRPSRGDWEPFKERLTHLLSFEQTLGITSKALEVMLQHEHSYCPVGVRVLTDLRPVFAEDVEAPPAAAVIVHTLKMTYHEGNEVKEFFVALSSRHLKHLREILDRAEKKAESLGTVFEAANMQCLDPEVN